MRRVIHGVHLCWGTYGFWLPNDPRGSGSQVRADHLRPFGDATFVPDRKQSRARTGHDRAARLAAKDALVRPPVTLDGHQAKCAALAFGVLLAELDIACWACAVLPDHVHLMVGPSGIDSRKLCQRLKGRATRALVDAGRHPFQADLDADGQVPKCWQRREWTVFKYDAGNVRRTIKYVADNPLKEGKPFQTWGFVVPDPADSGDDD